MIVFQADREKAEGKVKKHSLIFIILMCFFISAYYNQQEAEWKGKIEIEDGVEVINNPNEPIYDADVFGLVEELSIGEAEGRKDYMFSLIVSIDVDEKGNIYVLDIKERHIKVFDLDGRFIRIIGRMGQGPGELQNPYTVQITARNEVVIWDPLPQRLLYFSLNGEYKKSVSTAKLFNPPVLNYEGNIVSLVKIDDAENPKYELQKLDLELNPLTFYTSYQRPDFMRDVFPSFRLILQWAITNKNEIVCGYIDEGYNIKIFSPEGKIIRNIVKDYTPVKIPEEVIKRVTKRQQPPGHFYSIPKFYSAFRWIIVDEDNRMFVCTFERSKDKVERYYDVFSPEGKFIAKIPLEHEIIMGIPIIFKGGNLYLIQADEDGYQYVKRYKVTWNY